MKHNGNTIAFGWNTAGEADHSETLPIRLNISGSLRSPSSGSSGFVFVRFLRIRKDSSGYVRFMQVRICQDSCSSGFSGFVRIRQDNQARQDSSGLC